MSIIKQVYLAGILYIGQIISGFSLGWSSPVIPKLQDPHETPLAYPLTTDQASWISYILYIGTISGPFIFIWISNTAGRKACLYVGGGLSLMAYLLFALSNNINVIYAGRVFSGLGVGVSFIMNFVYIGEVASTKIRGLFLTGNGVFYALGTVLVYTIAPLVSFALINYIGLLITLLYMTGLFVIPESPLFLIIKGNEEKAKDILYIIGREDDIDNLITTSMTEQTQKPSELDQWKEIFTIKSNRKALFITLILNIIQQTSGFAAVTFFASSIISLAFAISPALAMTIIGLVQLVCSFVPPIFVEICERKMLLMVSSVGCFLSLAFLGTYFLLLDLNISLFGDIIWIPLVAMINFFVFYGVGLAIIPTTLTAEMFTSNVRSTGSTLALTISWLCNFAITVTLSFMLSLGASVPFWIFTAFCGFGFVFTVLFVPETKGLSLKEVSDLLGR